MTGIARIAAALAAALALGACRGARDQSVLESSGPQAARVEQLWWFSFWVAAAVCVLTVGALAWATWRARRRGHVGEPLPVGEDAERRMARGVAWGAGATVVILLVFLGYDLSVGRAMTGSPVERPLTIDVVGHQWWWEVRYNDPAPGGEFTTANEIHVPVGQPVQLLLESDNVLHSFWVPQMAGKRDLISNRVNRLIFTPREPGVYLGQCAEFCGDSHALMKMRLIAHTPQGFQEWLNNEARPAMQPTDSTSAVAVGRKLVNQGACAGCHTIKGTPMVGRQGPNLTHFGRRRTLAAGIADNNAANLTRWVRNAPGMKPGSLMPPQGQEAGGTLTEDQIQYVVAYLQSLQ
jgi:cytochrome c oxidase subunit 2